jgi:hypothetical protein
MKHNGPFSNNLRGSQGTVTASRWKGIAYFKEKSTQVANPNTAPQQIQRRRFKGLSEGAKVLSATLLFGFAYEAVGKTERNVFMSQNYPLTINSTESVFEVDLDNLKLSGGSNTTSVTSVAFNNTNDEITFTLASGSSADPDWNDDVYMCIFDAGTDIILQMEDDFGRSGGTTVIDVSALANGSYTLRWFTYRPGNKSTSPTGGLNFTKS